jgi:hypothetical protein
MLPCWKRPGSQLHSVAGSPWQLGTQRRRSGRVSKPFPRAGAREAAPGPCVGYSLPITVVKHILNANVPLLSQSLWDF